MVKTQRKAKQAETLTQDYIITRKWFAGLVMCACLPWGGVDLTAVETGEPSACRRVLQTTPFMGTALGATVALSPPASATHHRDRVVSCNF